MTQHEWIYGPHTVCYVRRDGYAVSADIVAEERNNVAHDLFGVGDEDLTDEQVVAVDRELFGFFDDEILVGHVDRFDEPATTHVVMEYRGPLATEAAR